jgi:hypothetical protein
MIFEIVNAAGVRRGMTRHGERFMASDVVLFGSRTRRGVAASSVAQGES